MKWCFILLSLISTSLLAKPSAPMLNKLHLTSINQESDASIYDVQVDFTPLRESQRVKFSLKIPKDFTLLEGFSYWEGTLDSGKSFQKLLKLKGPLGKEGKVELMATMEMDNTKSITRAILTLGASHLGKSSQKPIKADLGKIRR